MTDKQIEEKIEILKQGIDQEIDAKVNRALLCGAVDKESYADDFRLPKIIMTAVLRDLS
jgi:hypothetical protein